MGKGLTSIEAASLKKNMNHWVSINIFGGAKINSGGS